MTSANLPLRGACLCGGVRFEIDAPPEQATYCHCTRCQRRTGAGAGATATLAEGSLRILSGGELICYFSVEDGFDKGFCSECGAGLFSREPGTKDPDGVRLGIIDGDPGIRPDARQHVGSAAAWEPIPDDGLPRHEGPRPD